jgi:hypothetical protein
MDINLEGKQVESIMKFKTSFDSWAAGDLSQEDMMEEALYIAIFIDAKVQATEIFENAKNKWHMVSGVRVLGV